MTTSAFTCSRGDLVRAGILTRYGCQPRLRPLQYPEYRDLLRRYRQDAAFAGMVDSVAEGLQMDVIEAHDLEGLVLHPQEGSWLYYRIKDGNPRMGTEERLVLGLAHVAIAARAYPSPAHLEEDGVTRISVEEVDVFLRRLTERLRQATVGEDGLAIPHAELNTAWRLYAKLPSSKPGKSRRSLTHSSTQWVIRDALEWLVEQGMAYPATRDLGAGHYRLAHRFRLQVRECASLPAFALLCDIRRAQLIEED
ncbi:hypothetical protein [Streptomyces altiplanensis]